MPRQYTPRVLRSCRQCGVEFSAPPNRIASNRAHYCSKACEALARPRKTLDERLWAKVNKTNDDGCWIWTGATNIRGYGNIGMYKTPNGPMQTYLAHRASYEIAYGSVPSGMIVCHRCDVPACVNPAHLFLGTQKDNMRDMVQKGRHKP